MSYSSRRVKSQIKSEGNEPIEVIHYNTLLQEAVNKNGTIKQIHWVVKNSPFSLRLRANNLENWNWASTKVHCVVLSESSGKPIEMPKTEPILWHLTCAPGIPTESTLTIRLFPLSSSLENSYLIVRVTLSCLDQEFAFDTVPFKTVSKHEQVDRKKKEMGLIDDFEDDEEDVRETKKNPKKRKQNTTEALFNELTHLKEQNERMYQMLQLLSSRARLPATFAVEESSLQAPAPKRPKLAISPVPASPIPAAISVDSIDSEISEEDASMQVDSPVDLFVSGFNNLMSAFSALSDSDRQAAMERVSAQHHSFSQPMDSTVQLFADDLVRAGVCRPTGCLPEHCTHKAELDKVLQVYIADATDANPLEEISGSDEALSADQSLFDSEFPAPSLFNSTSSLLACHKSQQFRHTDLLDTQMTHAQSVISAV